ncbi:MAG: helix-turn-helix transcriptional regulator [Bacilli bacterium]|nr:helix-turn-helix transcriptional regulator [Bacilli bacterium]
MDLGKRFKHFREMKELTLKKAAELIGVKYYQLGNYETNRSEPSISVLKKMSQVYEVSIDGLVGNISIKKKEKDYSMMDDILKQLNELVDQINNNKE